jgi:DNA helicase-2/ATP-dependent DNA helicase PcrA
MMELNEQQLEAVEIPEGPILVIAGAGSGKTRLITCRVARLIGRGARPEQILAVTFTNRAAQEMRSRIEQMLGSRSRADAPLICTFHSLCARMLRRDIERLQSGYTRDFTIYDEEDQLRLVRAIVRELGLEAVSPRWALSSISSAKNRGLSPEDYADQLEYSIAQKERLARIYRLYQEGLRRANALDFDDLLIKSVQLLSLIREARQYYCDKFRHVMIDEFQDTNGIQYELVRLIAGEMQFEGRSLCVVGDVDQAIYGFRGSDFRLLLNFQRDFRGARLIKLERNYRSTETILEAANHLIQNNRKRVPKDLLAIKGPGEKIRYYRARDADEEAEFVAGQIQEHLCRWPDARLAILYRTNAQSRQFEEALSRRAIRYNIVGGLSFYERAEIKDITAYLKLALNPRDDVALERAINSPPRGIGRSTLECLNGMRREDESLWDAMGEALDRESLWPRQLASLRSFKQLIERLGELALGNEPMADLVRAAATESGYIGALREEGTDEAENRLLNIEELINAAAEAESRGETIREFVDRAALTSGADQYREDARVTLMTMHAAKGLEFDSVFMVGMEEGLFPHLRSARTDEDIEEERRLCYVAITRARQHLYLTSAMRRRSFGEEAWTQPSRFLREIPAHLVEDLSYRRDDRRNYAGVTFERRGWFRVGARVRHARYGFGTVVEVEGSGPDAKITVNFPGYGNRKFIAGKAALEKV